MKSRDSPEIEGSFLNISSFNFFSPFLKESLHIEQQFQLDPKIHQTSALSATFIPTTNFVP